jgi:hypothetical protein
MGGTESEAGAAAIVPRLESAVARVLPAIEATIARLAGGAQHPRELEQAGRALGALMRTLRELNVLLSEQQARAKAAAEDDDPVPENIDDFRMELARRIRGFVEAREAQQAADADEEAKPEET